ncbi:unnamed protein product [Moneuplotes crassus]|uniref:Uncharacterized protein n=1 Tax=Euplotes crassus TaxID=5936 RepID=A0AAD1UDU3_EUPCR|nr:unnamed protein product [Moneuplotes crassus]
MGCRFIKILEKPDLDTLESNSIYSSSKNHKDSHQIMLLKQKIKDSLRSRENDSEKLLPNQGLNRSLELINFNSLSPAYVPKSADCMDLPNNFREKGHSLCYSQNLGRRQMIQKQQLPLVEKTLDKNQDLKTDKKLLNIIIKDPMKLEDDKIGQDSNEGSFATSRFCRLSSPSDIIKVTSYLKSPYLTARGRNGKGKLLKNTFKLLKSSSVERPKWQGKETSKLRSLVSTVGIELGMTDKEWKSGGKRSVRKGMRELTQIKDVKKDDRNNSKEEIKVDCMRISLNSHTKNTIKNSQKGRKTYFGFPGKKLSGFRHKSHKFSNDYIHVKIRKQTQ